MPATYPGGGPQITVEALMKQPKLIARALTDLTNHRFVADRVFAKGTAEQVAGGASLFQRSESIYPNRDVEEVGVRSRYPRAAWTEALFTANVRKFGLEVPIADEAKRRNQMDIVARAQRKIANGMVKFVDALAMVVLQDTTAGVQTFAGSGDWSTPATDIIFDVARAIALIVDTNEGYEADTLIVHPNQHLDLMTDLDLRNVFPREGGSPKPAALTGKAVPFLGLDQVLVTPTATAGKAVVTAKGVAGTIADEAPGADEGYSTFQPGPDFAPVWAKVYREDGVDESIVRGARFPAMWLGEPTAVVTITGI